LEIHVVAVTSDDLDDVGAFLQSEEWPFHVHSRLTAELVAEMSFVDDDTASYWISTRDEPVGLLRLLDLGDVDDGAPLFDLRIAAAHRGRGVGSLAVRWLTSHLFATYPQLHRIEATTRQDNVAMQRALERNGYMLEGRLREAWMAVSGQRFDTLLYGILRTDRQPE
jgi:RimJ/RimL family protein N-acetyltransferase